MRLRIGDYTIYSHTDLKHHLKGMLNPWITSPNSPIVFDFELGQMQDPATISLKLALELRSESNAGPVLDIQGNLLELEQGLQHSTVSKDKNSWRISFPWEVESSFIMDAPWGIDSSVRCERSVLDQFMKLYEAFTEKNVDRLMELAHGKIDYTARATHQPVASLNQRTRAMFSNIFSSPSALWSGLVNPALQLEVIWVKENSVCRIRDLDGDPPLRTEINSDDDFFEGVDVVFGFCKGKWAWIY